MADKIEYSRMLVKRTAQTGEVPTIPPVTAVTLNQMIPTDLFVGEFYLNEVDDLLWIRTENGILPISLSGSTGTTITPTLTEVLYEGNATNGYNIEVSAGDTIVFSGLSSGVTSQFLGIDASGNTIVSSVSPGTPDLEDVLTVGNSTGPYNISVDIGYKVEGQSGGNWVRPETADGYLELNTDTELTILGITSGVTDIVLSYDPDTKFVKYQSISGGTAGSAGTSGTSGTSGSSGSSGTSGTDGTNGTSGTSGIDGTSGTSGSSGSSGTSGTNGSSGTSGVSGIDGSSGTSGTSGLSGVNGTNGTSGTSGINGTSGTSGTSGISGTDGSSGTSGTSGISGSSGSSGSSGTSGIDGSSGTSGTSGSGTSGTSGSSGTSGTSATPSPFETSTGLNSVRSVYYTTNAPNPYDMLIGGSGNTITNSTKFNHIFGGENNTISADRVDGLNTIIGSYDSIIGPTYGGLASGIFSSYDSSIIDYAGYGSVILGGRNNTVNNAMGAIVGGQNNIANYRSFVGGGNTNTCNSLNGAVIGGEYNTCNSNGGGIFAGYANTFLGNNDIGNAFLGGYSNRFDMNGTYGCALIGGVENRWHHFDIRGIDPRYSYGIMMGGRSNRIEGETTDSAGSHAHPLMMGGKSNKIFGSETYDTATTGATIMNSSGSTIYDSLYCGIIEGIGSVVSGKTQAVMIGTSGRTANDDNTTYTENQRSFGQIYNGYYDNGSGSTFTIDWNRGNSQKITITGNASLTFTNNKDGAQYRLQVVNTGTYDITGVTASGYSILCEGGAIPNITNNGVDLCVLEVMGEDILVRHFANFATP